MLSDIRYAFRQLGKAPGFTTVAVLTLAIGITVNAVFTTVANDLFFRPLPATEPNRLVIAAWTAPAAPAYQLPFSYADAVDFRSFVEGNATTMPDMARIFSGLMAYKEQIVHLSRTGTSTERSWVHAATDNYFSVLGVQPHLGRFFQPQDTAAPGSEPVIVLTYDTWFNRFRGDPDIVGQTVKLNAIPFTVIGVAKPGFVGASWGTALSGFVPATMLTKLLPDGQHWALNRGQTSTFLMGRLRPGVSLPEAQAAVEVAFARILKDNPGTHLPNSLSVVRWERHSRPSPYIAQNTPKILGALSALSVLVLVVALANTASLLYARSANRERELAIRSAVGATRVQLLRQLLAESLLLALFAGIVGALASLWATPALYAILPTPANIAPAAPTAIDWRPFVATALVSLSAGLLAGLLPALKASGVAPLSFMRIASPRFGHGRHALRNILVVVQVAVSTVVLVGSALALRSVVLLARADLGFRLNDLHLASFDLGAQNYGPKKAWRFRDNLLESVRALPGVEAASLTSAAPLDTGINNFGGIKSAEAGAEDKGLSVPVIFVEADYLRTIGMPIVAGRDLTIRDDAKAPGVAIINQALARSLWPERNAVGQRISIQGRVAEVVGIVGDSRYYSIQNKGNPLLIVPETQQYRGGAATLLVRSAVGAPSPLPAIAEIVRKLDADLPLNNPHTLREHIEQSASGLMPFKMGATLAGILGGIALGLAAAGIFGLISFGIARRTREIGIRMALGASRLEVIRAVTRESTLLTIIGLAVGLVGAFVLSRLLAGLLYGTGQFNALVFGGVALVVLIATVLACWLPARRATKVNPVEALRAE